MKERGRWVELCSLPLIQHETNLVCMLASLNYRIAETQECRRHVLRRRSEDELLLLDAPGFKAQSAQEQGEGDIARLPPNCVHHSDEAMQTSRHRQKQTSLKLLVSYFFIRPQTRGRRTLAVREEDCTQFAREAVYRPKGERQGLHTRTPAFMRESDYPSTWESPRKAFTFCSCSFLSSAS